MTNRIRLLGALADPTRLRILSALRESELSVAELQEVLGVGQSRISNHLAQLKAVGLLRDRREGQKAYYRRAEVGREIWSLAEGAASELATQGRDGEALRRVLGQRQEKSKRYFDAVAGRLGKKYCPGRSWEAVGRLLLALAPRQVYADLGAGEGLISQLLAARAKKVIAVDHSPRMVEVGRDLAKRSGLKNLEYRQGDMEQPPIRPGSVDVVILSQALHHAVHPPRALEAAWKILRPGGTVLILDLMEHSFEAAREMYADVWLGFAPAELSRLLREAGFEGNTVEVVAKEKEGPGFQTLLAVGMKSV
ncbi:MAG: methyltransferase domain-containing protein [Verrucomicrobia bacterium]|nr:methyltransferase domain-containing protein [Verrucomicrobiota bacterium]NBT24099.1 methyltransferase domain-containing protein [bacterium]NBV97065.1 methyltransferase domain-containing protein [Verrucomicrobiota bacterium]NBY65942.1 methyltransferase domain-containing protein [Verrucomicrobiota bacterium]